MLDLALGDQILDGAGDVFDGHLGINAVLIKQIDAIGAQTLQRGLGHGADMFRAAVGSAAACAGDQVYIEAELGGDDDLLADRLQGLAQ